MRTGKIERIDIKRNYAFIRSTDRQFNENQVFVVDLSDHPEFKFHLNDRVKFKESVYFSGVAEPLEIVPNVLALVS